MRTTPIGIVMLSDQREHVYSRTRQKSIEVVDRWTKIIHDGFRNLDGSTPDLVAGSQIITSPQVARSVGEEISRANCKQIILCYFVWDFPYLVWPFINTVGRDKPILSLSNNSGDFPGNVGLLATDGALRQIGIRTHRIMGDMENKEVQSEVFRWIRAAQAFTLMQNEVYGMYGGHSMGMETGYFHLVPVLKTIGTTVCQIDQLLLVKKMEEVNQAEVEKGISWLETLLGNRLRYDGRMLTPVTLRTQIRLYLALRLLNRENGIDFCGLKGQRELTEYVCLGDLAEMLMNDPYDWNGPKETTVCATEADAFAAITMEILKYISGGLPVLFMDVRLYHPEYKLWDWCNSGNHSSWYASQSMDPKDNFKKITFHPALELYFKAGGASIEFDAAPSKMTFARLALWNDQLYMVMLTGESVQLSPKESKIINAQTNPTWPHVHVKLDCDFEEFLRLFPCNHVLGVSGDRLRELTYYCEISGIKPIILGPPGKIYISPIWSRVS